MRIGSWEYNGWEMIAVVWCGLVGMLWGLLALWIGFTWQWPLPALDLAGVVNLVLLWPFWAARLASPVLAPTGWGAAIFFLPELVGLLAGLLVGLILVKR